MVQGRECDVMQCCLWFTQKLHLTKLSRVENTDDLIMITISGKTPINEIKDFLRGGEIADIEISKKSRHAIVTLKNGDFAEKLVQKFNHRKLLGAEVEVALYPLLRMLCVSHLPSSIQNDEDLVKFLEEFGPLEKSFLMRSPDGKSKGYGFVEFAHNREKLLDVKEDLDGLQLKANEAPLHCDFVKENILQYDHLHSRCLLVSNLPDLKETSVFSPQLFEAKFSQLHKPSQCKFVYKDGREYLNSAIVQYANPLHAQNVKAALNGTKMDTKTMNISFLAPGFNKIKEMIDRVAVVEKQKKRVKKRKAAGLPTPSMPPILNDAPGALASGPAAVNLSQLTDPVLQMLLSQNPAVLEIYTQVLQQLQDQPKVFSSPLVQNVVNSQQAVTVKPSTEIQHADTLLQDLVTKPGVSIKSPMRKESAAPGAGGLFQTPKGALNVQTPPMHHLLKKNEQSSKDNCFGQILLALQNPSNVPEPVVEEPVTENKRPAKIPSLLNMDPSRVHTFKFKTTELPKQNPQESTAMPPPADPAVCNLPVTVPRLAISIEGQIRQQLAYLDDMKKKGISETATLAAQNNELLAKFAPPESMDMPPPPMPPFMVPEPNGKNYPERQKLDFNERDEHQDAYKGLYNYYNDVVNKYNNVVNTDRGPPSHQQFPPPPPQDGMAPGSFTCPPPSLHSQPPPPFAPPVQNIAQPPPVSQPSVTLPPPSSESLPPANQPPPGVILDPEQQAAYDDYLRQYKDWEKQMAEYEEQMRQYRMQYPEAAAALDARNNPQQPPPPGAPNPQWQQPSGSSRPPLATSGMPPREGLQPVMPPSSGSLDPLRGPPPVQSNQRGPLPFVALRGPNPDAQGSGPPPHSRRPPGPPSPLGPPLYSGPRGPHPSEPHEPPQHPSTGPRGHQHMGPRGPPHPEPQHSGTHAPRWNPDHHGPPPQSGPRGPNHHNPRGPSPQSGPHGPPRNINPRGPSPTSGPGGPRMFGPNSFRPCGPIPGHQAPNMRPGDGPRMRSLMDDDFSPREGLHRPSGQHPEREQWDEMGEMGEPFHPEDHGVMAPFPGRQQKDKISDKVMQRISEVFPEKQGNPSRPSPQDSIQGYGVRTRTGPPGSKWDGSQRPNFLKRGDPAADGDPDAHLDRDTRGSGRPAGCSIQDRLMNVASMDEEPHFEPMESPSSRGRGMPRGGRGMAPPRGTPRGGRGMPDRGRHMSDPGGFSRGAPRGRGMNGPPRGRGGHGPPPLMRNDISGSDDFVPFDEHKMPQRPPGFERGRGRGQPGLQRGRDGPGGLKRPFPLPSPECSPEGVYVGQHSQGLGGHYQHTHLIKRQRVCPTGRGRGRPY
ncbi:hypothetical protein CAPTEDRAFT_219417 [Capitella teleta]|uniref:RRM domain-containing protein n=1 Tax=Capitella teleta TaxID=283909 RepID=R7T867_CAPTE|nr:hypothetical protein CAPTEDRAFT_219417 [Capitella teleta]|eukprot:ELT89643.1 hypothetical protein CAPTEDRAFT_219417 [Capitella teleta]